jgi:hypothetical protein
LFTILLTTYKELCPPRKTSIIGPLEGVLLPQNFIRDTHIYIDEKNPLHRG